MAFLRPLKENSYGFSFSTPYGVITAARTHIFMPSEHEAESPHLDPKEPKVRRDMTFLFNHAFTMFTQGLLEEDSLPQLVQEELCDRIGMSGEEFEVWLGFAPDGGANSDVATFH